MEWNFLENHQTVFTPIYELTEQRDYAFDVAKGMVTRVITRSKQGWPAGRADESSTHVIALVESRQLDSAELAALNADMEKYYAAKAERDAIESKKTFKNTAEIAEKSLATYRALEGKLQTPFFQQLLDEQLKQAERYGKYELESAERFAKLIDQPSQDWQTTDLDGNPRSLADYRGKVVLLDFWYRGCGWCIRAMPQFKQLVDDFAGQPVAILGMNNDKNFADAKFVIDKMGLNYTSLKNGDGDDAINKKYGVQGWPTLVVLDGQGVIRHIHVGYSPNLRKELGDKIRELLANKQAAK
jgi:thiol-disulfide isomerase/thioredoxin